MTALTTRMHRWLSRHPVPGPPEPAGPPTLRESLLSEERRLLLLRRSRAFRSPMEDEDVAWVHDVERRWQACQRALADLSLRSRQTQVGSSESQQRKY